MGKVRSLKRKFAVLTFPFLLIFFPKFYFSFYTGKFSDETFFSRILIYWLGYLCIVLAIVITGNFFSNLEIRRLRKSAAISLGWIAGNASGTPYWQSLVDENSEYYRALMVAGNDEARLYANLYDTWRKRGGNEPYNEKKCEKLYKTVGRKIKKADSYMKGSVPKSRI